MYHTINEFLEEWRVEAHNTEKMFAELTDASLDQRVTPEGRSVRTLAWHIVVSVGEMMQRVGLPLGTPAEHAPEAETAAQIAETYRTAATALGDRIRDRWTDASLAEEHDMYGETWNNAMTLRVLVIHQVHHRAQLTVLMRQAGLRVPGLYGPSREEWAAYGMEPHA